MDFVAVPPGTLPPAALILRGPDHDLDLAPGDDFIAAIGVAIGARNNAGGARRLTPYSSVSGILSGFFVSDDPALLACIFVFVYTFPAPFRNKRRNMFA